MSIVSLDLETTGLDERIHEAWEVALVTESGEETCWQFPLRKRFNEASQKALEIGGFLERYSVERGLAMSDHGSGRTHLRPEWAAEQLHARTVGATLMGCAIQFDMRFLTELMRAYGVEPEWHHRSLDLGSYAAGVLEDVVPLSSAELAAGVPNPDAHTALGDARWNWEVYRWLRRQ